MITQFGQEGIVYLRLKIIGVESRYSGACDYVLMWRSWSARYVRLPGLNKILTRLIPHSPNGCSKTSVPKLVSGCSQAIQLRHINKVFYSFSLVNKECFEIFLRRKIVNMTFLTSRVGILFNRSDWLVI